SEVGAEGPDISGRIGRQTEQAVRLIDAVRSNVGAGNDAPTGAVEVLNQGQSRRLGRWRNGRRESNGPHVVRSEREYAVELVGTAADAGSLDSLPTRTVEVHRQRAAVVVFRAVEAHCPDVVGGIGGSSEKKRIAGDGSCLRPARAVPVL